MMPKSEAWSDGPAPNRYGKRFFRPASPTASVMGPRRRHLDVGPGKALRDFCGKLNSPNSRNVPFVPQLVLSSIRRPDSQAAGAKGYFLRGEK
jgi:hypothetical protein